MKVEYAIELVNQNPGWSFPSDRFTPDEWDRIALETGTVLEFDERDCPRFMPKDKRQAWEIRNGWRGAGLDPYGYDREGRKVT